MPRHVPGFIRGRNRLETKTAAIRSKATVPMPTQNRLYDEVKGTRIAAHPMCTYVSRTLVKM
jgi:hypothetical protein